MKFPFYASRGLLFAAGLATGIYASPAVSALDVYTDAFIYDSSTLFVGPFDQQNAATGPLQASVNTGLVLTYPYPGYEGILQDLEVTLYARANAHADYGINGAFLELNLSATSANDRGAFPNGVFSGSLPINSSLEPHASASSGWTDTFVINGGTGVGTANVDVLLGGFAETRYGANGTIWYGNSSFEAFGRGGFGFVQYGLDIDYNVLPPGVDSEYDQPIRWNMDYLPPAVPDYVQIVGQPPPGTLTGSFVFEYGVPFDLSSFLTLSGDNQISMDYDNTATLSRFVLPVGASLTSSSGHLYTTSTIPVPPAVWLFGSGLLGLIGIARRKKAA